MEDNNADNARENFTRVYTDRNTTTLIFPRLWIFHEMVVAPGLAVVVEIYNG